MVVWNWPTSFTGVAKITEDIFCEWVLNVFIPHVQSVCVTLQLVQNETALLLLDGHSSRGRVRALSAMRDAGIVARTLPPHTSHVCQPLDRSVFRVFKKTIGRGVFMV